MRTMDSRVRKFVLTTHITVSVGWVGAVGAYLALVVTAWTTQEVLAVRAAWLGMEVIGWYILVPLAIASLLTGLVMALGTRWGVFRHYWVLFSFLLTLLATAVLISHMPTVSFYANLAATADTASRTGLRGELLHAGVGLLVLLVITGLNVYKPRGLTPYGQRKLQEQRTESQV